MGSRYVVCMDYLGTDMTKPRMPTPDTTVYGKDRFTAPKHAYFHENVLALNKAWAAYCEAELARARAENERRQDMANVGEALMETIKGNVPDYCWNDCPSEVVVDLINERDEMKAERDAAIANADNRAQDVLCLRSDIKTMQGQLARMEAELAQAWEELAISKSFVAAQAGLHAGDVETLKADRDAAAADAKRLRNLLCEIRPTLYGNVKAWCDERGWTARIDGAIGARKENRNG